MTYRCRMLVIACGGQSYPNTGTTGDGFRLAKSLGHTISVLAPGLTPALIKEYRFAHCAGISLKNTAIHLNRSNKKIKQAQGDVLFTHKGLSGPGILDLSRFIHPGDQLRIPLVDFKNSEDFEKDLMHEISVHGKKALRNVLIKYQIQGLLLKQVFEFLTIPIDLSAPDVNKKTRKQLVSYLTEFPFEVSRLGNFKEAMVTRGGVALTEINRNTMESRLIPNLYFAGEVIDIDGDTGGYNLQFAFSSAVLAGNHT